jgi:carbonic anhydrase
VFGPVRLRALSVVVASVCLLSGCAGGDDSDSDTAVPAADSWTHDPGDDTGPARWGSVDESYKACVEGTRQSPVDLGGAVPGSLPPLEFDYSATPLVVENTGHTVEVAMPEGSRHTLTIGGEVHRLAQYHFHTPSEHTVAGERRAMEAHLVHEGEGGRLAVVAVFLSERRPPSPLVTTVLEQAPDEAGERSEPGGQASPAGLLPAGGIGPLTIVRYATYSGSLTTPACSEGVRWIVLTDEIGVSDEATERLRELVAAFPGYDGFERNNRPTQELNGRAVRRDER